jgi:hypothetical protein
LGANGFEEAFRPEAAVDFAYADLASAWLLIYRNEMVCHHGAICGPWGMSVSQPISPSCHLKAETFGFSSECTVLMYLYVLHTVNTQYNTGVCKYSECVAIGFYLVTEVDVLSSFIVDHDE